MVIKANAAVARKVDVDAAVPLWHTYLVMRYSYAKSIGLKDADLVAATIPDYCAHKFDKTSFLEERHGHCKECSDQVWGRA